MPAEATRISGKVMSSAVRLIVVPAAGGLIVGASVRRKRLVFFPCGAGYYSIYTQQPATANVAILVNTNMSPVAFDRDIDGSVTQQEWYAFPNGGTITIGVLEVMD